MKYINKLILTIAFFAFISCNDEKSATQDTLTQENFSSKTFEMYEDLTINYFPKEDVKYSVFKNTDGLLVAKFEVIGKTKKEIEMGSFVSNARDGGGTTCDGKWSCGKAIYNCLENNQAALITPGACQELSAQYCVTCQNPD